MNNSLGEIEYYYCKAATSVASDTYDCLGLNPDLITLGYLVSSFTYHRA